jgi:hypothetical protein
MDEPVAVLDFDCPRCAVAVQEPYYGPCECCRAVLRANLRSEARDVDTAGFEPKMNVTPNAVALKE